MIKKENFDDPFPDRVTNAPLFIGLGSPIEKLSVSELRELEGDEREKVIARIGFLRNFRA